MALEEIREERIQKLNVLRSHHMDPFPSHTERSYVISESIANFSTLAEQRKEVILIGRILAKREHGGSTFINIRDGSGEIQAYFKRDILKEEYTIFLDTVDVGDIISVRGVLFETKKAEKTVEVLEWKMLAKSLRPLPEKWHGLLDVEERFRKRYLDILMNVEIRELFVKKSAFY